MKIIWSSRAQADVTELFDFILEENPTAAWNMYDRIMQNIENLQDHPGLGRPGRVPNTRELIISGTPYIVPYRITGGILQILRVFHSSRRWPDNLDH